jgi:hypothetical protein
MILVDEHSTIDAIFFRAAQKYAQASFLAVPANAARDYDPAGREISYGEAASVVRELTQPQATASVIASRCSLRTGPSTCCTSWQ